MTDARLPERWLNDRRLLRLTPSAFRTFVMALTWSVSNRTDGVIDLADFDLIPCARREDLPELIRQGLMSPGTVPGDAAGGQSREPVVLVDFAATQTSSDELTRLDNARRREREKKARQRARKDEARDSPGGTSRGTVPGDITGQARPGQDRQAPTEGPPTEAREREPEAPAAEPAAGWPPTLCTTSGHAGCAWQNTDECPDCLEGLTS